MANRCLQPLTDPRFGTYWSTPNYCWVLFSGKVLWKISNFFTDKEPHFWVCVRNNIFLPTQRIPLNNIRGQAYDNSTWSIYWTSSSFQSSLQYGRVYTLFCAFLTPSRSRSCEFMTKTCWLFLHSSKTLHFLSASPQRCNNINKFSNLQYSLKSLSLTRWCANYEGNEALKHVGRLIPPIRLNMYSINYQK